MLPTESLFGRVKLSMKRIAVTVGNGVGVKVCVDVGKIVDVFVGIGVCVSVEVGAVDGAEV